MHGTYFFCWQSYAVALVISFVRLCATTSFLRPALYKFSGYWYVTTCISTYHADGSTVSPCCRFVSSHGLAVCQSNHVDLLQ